MTDARHRKPAIATTLAGGIWTGGPTKAHGEWLGGVWDAFARDFAIEVERRRLSLWAPVAMIAGVVAFFSADGDPSLTASLILFAISVGAAFLLKRRGAGFVLAVLVACVALGFLAAGVQAWRVAAPVLDREMWGDVVGVVERVEPRGRSTRLLIRAESLGRLAPEAVPQRVRISVRGAAAVRAGQRISIGGLWRPPPSASRPGGYDFARMAYFEGLGAVGANARDLRVLDPPEAGYGERFLAAVDGLRNRLTARITVLVPGDSGAIAAALVTGQRGDISNAANDALRIAGLYHVISISGLHMALFGGTLFVAVRFLLALVPGLALGYPIKKWAAAVAIIGAGGYLILSGGQIAAQRSFLMLALVLVAVLLDRQAITMRNLAVAAIVTLLVIPDAALGPSFQMSFAAVLLIVAWYEARRFRRSEQREDGRWSAGYFGTYFGGITATTIAATFATAPVAAYHFQRIALHSLPSNLIALPVVGVVVMPMALIGFLLYPLGLDAPAWIVMGWGISIMLAVAYWIASWPFATIDVPAFGAAAVMLLAFGLCWLGIWTTRLRWLAVLPLAAGVVLALMPGEPPFVYADPAGRAAAVRGEDGSLQILGGRFANFAAQNWLTADGDGRNPRDEALTSNVDCDSHGCTAPIKGGGHLALNWSYAALAEDCRRAAVVITRLIAPPACRETAFVIDGRDLAQGGAVALYRDGDDIRPDRARRADRPWSRTKAPPDGPAFPSASADPPAIPARAESMIPEADLGNAEPESAVASEDGSDDANSEDF